MIAASTQASGKAGFINTTVLAPGVLRRASNSRWVPDPAAMIRPGAGNSAGRAGARPRIARHTGRGCPAASIQNNRAPVWACNRAASPSSWLRWPGLLSVISHRDGVACCSVKRVSSFVFAPVKTRVVFIRPGFEAPVHPQVLIRRLADLSFDNGVHPCGICEIITGGEVLQCRLKVNV